MPTASRLVVLFGCLVIAALAVAIWLDRQRAAPPLEVDRLEHLSHEALGLPPHYWAYLRHSWEWSDVHDSAKAREALFESILQNEPHALYNAAMVVLSRNDCDVLDGLDLEISLRTANRTAEPGDLPAYDLLRRLCGFTNIETAYDQETLLEVVAQDRSDVSMVLVLLMIEERIITSGYRDGIDQLETLVRKHWRGNYFIQRYFTEIYEKHKTHIAPIQKVTIAPVLIRVRISLDYHADILRGVYRPLESYNSDVGQYAAFLKQSVDLIGDLSLSEISSGPLHFCHYQRFGPKRSDICIQRASYDHSVCSTILRGNRDVSLSAYAACRTRSINHHLAQMEDNE